MRVRWVRCACREERSKRNLSCLQRGRERRAVTRPATVSARERASASTNASEPRGVPAATSLSGRWVTPRAEATAEPVAAEWVFAVHLGREGRGRSGRSQRPGAGRPRWRLRGGPGDAHRPHTPPRELRYRWSRRHSRKQRKGRLGDDAGVRRMRTAGAGQGHGSPGEVRQSGRGRGSGCEGDCRAGRRKLRYQKDFQRGARDTPNSMGAEKRRSRGLIESKTHKSEEIQTNAGHKRHPHETGSRHTHTCQSRRPPNRQPQTTSDHLSRGTREATQRGRLDTLVR
jgi:hypothetical protein